MNPPAQARPADDGRSITVIIAAGAVVLAISFGIRSTFGGVVGPLEQELGWSREVFSFSLALQNIVWGLAQPLFGVIADKFGDRKAMWLGLVCYIAGMALAAVGMTPLAQHVGAGLLVGMGVSGTAFGLVLTVVGRAAPEHKRSQYMGLVAALGSTGQVLFPYLAGELLVLADWRTMLWVMTALLLPMALCIPFLKARSPAPGAPTTSAGYARNQMALNEMGMLETLRRAFGHSSYVLLTLGFFVCGYHVAFIGVHFPAYVAEQCGDPALGLQALSIVGLMNIIGTLVAGQLGARFPKPYVLSTIYALRALVIFVFISVPTTPLSAILFAVAIGPLWLSTVPLTSGLVVTMFGPKYLATLYGFVFLSHQLGSFLGIWLGGRLYDLYGSYDLIWWSGIALGLLSAALHLPVRERAYQVAQA